LAQLIFLFTPLYRLNRTNIVYILFFAVNVVVIQRFWTSLKHA